MSPQSELLHSGIEAYQQQRYYDAVEIFKRYCTSSDYNNKEYLQAQFWLIKAYQKNQSSCAIALAKQLATHPNPEAQKWAKLALEFLKSNQLQSRITHSKPKRAAQAGIKLAIAGVASNLALASGVTITLLLGMVFVLFLALTLILSSDNLIAGLNIAIAGTLIFNTAAFFLSPFLMDLMQNWLYHTRWVSLAEVQHQSPEAARIIQRICAQQKLQQPRLGIIDDQNPTAFTYGSLPNAARLVVSQGLFTYLEDEEIATVYAHELGHIVHWDFAVMTLASTLVQITYLIYTFARRLGRSGGEKIKNATGTAAAVAYVFYIVGTYLLLYLSRTREYFADHFAAETTGNPNALSRALVKIAYGILEESKHAAEPSRLIEGTRALGIYDGSIAATATGTAYRIAQPQQLGRVFLWDMFNPWGWFMELNSTHPLTGKRVRALSNYAEQLGLETEFDLSHVVAEGKSLDKKKLYSNFALDVLLYAAEAIGIFSGLVVGLFLVSAEVTSGSIIIATVLIGFGIGTLIKTAVMFPNFQFAASSDVFNLMSDPYASPLRGKPVRLKGELIGRGDAGYQFGSDLKLQDRTGMLYLRYASRFGSFGNFFFGMNRVKNLIGSPVSSVGWFRRGVMPWLDLVQLRTDAGTVVNSYHRFWSYVTGSGAIVLGLVILLLF
ncbi:M48 family metalloprotease [Gloeocapsopsis dulcis]|uniref:Peptidase M48 n=1 Tax=Gloeocapsopsis dulcis AAB1 = 1H9 TaxID=1433147 RepID=A0A6N8FUH5_9CHRO|nr:M48 family metalloprotease [Gloeocapsopsis dulcis]MUL36242.1 peptidase M48 [Gloeocapsopsis dulcis AAB1 = 1H9]WNN89645.1 M48 family metalloprotease [Gloeocapsopsis dulcis]